MRDLDAELWIGGHGPLTKTLMQLARDLGLAEREKAVGFIPDPLLVAYYETCDVFCMPSVERSEQFGLVQLEAMYCSKPVVTTRLGTGVEYVTLDGETAAGSAEDPLTLQMPCAATWHPACVHEGAAGRQRIKNAFRSSKWCIRLRRVSTRACR